MESPASSALRGIRSPHVDSLAGILVCLPMAVLYFVGVQRSIGSGDSADLVIAAYTLGIPHTTGYPLYTWLGKLFSFLPFGGIAFRVTLMSPVFALLTLFLVFRIAVKEIESIRPDKVLAYAGGMLAVVLLGLSRPFWHSAEIAEVYALNAFTVTLFIWLYLAWLRNGNVRYLYGSALVLGISLGTHLSNVSLVLVFMGLTLLIARRWLPLLKSGALFLAGASQYLYLLIRAKQAPPYIHAQAHFFERLQWTGTANPLRNWLWFVTGARWHEASMTSLGEALSKMKSLGGWILRAYEVPGIILFGFGVVLYFLLSRNRKGGILLLGIMAFQFAYYLAYRQSLPGMILPFFGTFALFIALGPGLAPALIARLAPGFAARFSSSTHVRKGGYLVFIAAVAAFLVHASISRPVIDYSYDNIPSQFFFKMIEKIPAGSTVDGVAWTYSTIFDYYKIVEGRNIPFRIGQCDDETIAAGKCFLLGTIQDVKRYQEAGLALIPYATIDVNGRIPILQVHEKPQ